MHFLEFVDVDRFRPLRPQAAGPYRDHARQKAALVVAYDRKAEVDDRRDEPAVTEEIRSMEVSLAEYGHACEAALRLLPVARAICPSGLVGWSVAFLEAAQRVGLPSVYVETWMVRPGHMIWNLDRPALEQDFVGWRRIMGEWESEKERQVQERLWFREFGAGGGRPWVSEFRWEQRSDPSRPLPATLEQFLHRPGPRFVLGPNVVGDSAMLGKATIFRTQRDWVEGTCAFFRGRPDLNLVIRAHPDEMVWSSEARVGDTARKAAGDAPNIFVLGGEEDVNTYSIVRRVQAGLCWTSTLGPDMILLGKPVLVAAAAEYLPLGVGVTARSRQEYYAKLDALAQGVEAPSAEMTHAAKVYTWIVLSLSLNASFARLVSRTYRIFPPQARPEQELFFAILAGEVASTPPGLLDARDIKSA